MTAALQPRTYAMEKRQILMTAIRAILTSTRQGSRNGASFQRDKELQYVEFKLQEDAGHDRAGYIIATVKPLTLMA